jgi:hypothetical protein
MWLDYLKQFAISIVGSSVVLGVVLFILRKYLGSLISHEFDKRTKLFASLLERENKIADHMLDKQLAVYPEILEVTYRLRNILRDGLQETHAFKWSKELRPLCAFLTENLFKYRLFLPDDVFQALHEFKRICQDALVFVDVHTREDHLFDRANYEAQRDLLLSKFERSEQLYDRVVSLMEEKLSIPNAKWSKEK